MRGAKESEWQRRQRRNTMRAEHDGLCDICGAALGDVGLCKARRGRALDEDHDHSTGLHRGFVCARANRMLWSWVTPEWLRKTADYLDAQG